MNDVQVQYQGFHPSEFARVYLENMLMQIHERSPYGSLLRATFIREGERLKAQVRITSAAGEFFAVARGRRLREVGRKAFGQIGKQLERWKSVRHGGRNHGTDVA
jgi:hypothetical protein